MTFAEDIQQRYSAAADRQKLDQHKNYPNQTHAQHVHTTLLNDECQQTLEALDILLKGAHASDEVLLNGLIEFLKARDSEVTRTRLGYTAEPNSTANQLCKSIAEIIIQKKPDQRHADEPRQKNRELYRVLMPSLNILPLCAEMDHRWFYASEDLPDYGTFILSDALLAGRQGHLISYKSVITYSKELFLYANLFYSRAQANTLALPRNKRVMFEKMCVSETPVLTPREMQRIREFHSHGQHLLKVQDDQLIHGIDSTIPLQQLTILIAALRRGGRSGGEGGTDMEAGRPAHSAVAAFFDYFNRLPEDLQRSLRACQPNSFLPTYNLGKVLDILTHTQSGLTCVEENAKLLTSILECQKNWAILNTNPYISLKPKDDPFKAAASVSCGSEPLQGYPRPLFENRLETATNINEYIALLEAVGGESTMVTQVTQRMVTLLSSTPDNIDNRIFNLLYQLSDENRRIFMRLFLSQPQNITLNLNSLKRISKFLTYEEIRAICKLIDGQSFYSNIVQFSHDLQDLLDKNSCISCDLFPNTIKSVIRGGDDLLYLFLKLTHAQCIVIFEILFHAGQDHAHMLCTHKFISDLIRTQQLAPLIPMILDHVVTIIHNYPSFVSTSSEFEQLIRAFGVNQLTKCAVIFVRALPDVAADVDAFNRLVQNHPREKLSAIFTGHEACFDSYLESIHDRHTLRSFLSSLPHDLLQTLYLRHQSKIDTILFSKRSLTATDFNNAFHCFATTHRTAHYERLKASSDDTPYYFDFLQDAVDFLRVFEVLLLEQRIEIYTTLQCARNDCPVARVRSPDTLRSLLKLLPKAQCKEICDSLSRKMWLKTSDVNDETFRQLIIDLDSARRDILLASVMEDLPAFITTAQTFQVIFVLINDDKVRTDYHNRFSDEQRSAFVKTSRDFIFITQYMTRDQCQAFWKGFGDRILDIFPSRQSLETLPANSPLREYLSSFIDGDFARQYTQLREAQSLQFIRTDVLASREYRDKRDFERVLYLWNHVQERPAGRSSQALRKALASRSHEEKTARPS